ncbi:MAG: FHA domain-containing protein [Planctomycetota bacterium]|nr:FHA domain-containing protein [Planctomycetota bacterium]MDA1139937.1 FHA domain-containing protein [Planctomycetota bacterium]
MPYLIDEQNKKIYKWSGAEAFLGRTPDNAIQVKHTAVSRHHCVVTLVDGEYFIEDLGSRNGTGMNGGKLPVAEPMLLEPGDVIQFGPLKLRFDLKIPKKEKPAAPSPEAESIPQVAAKPIKPPEEVRESPRVAPKESETVSSAPPGPNSARDQPGGEATAETAEPLTEKTRSIRQYRKPKPVIPEKDGLPEDEPQTEVTRIVESTASTAPSVTTPVQVESTADETSKEAEAHSESVSPPPHPDIGVPLSQEQPSDSSSAAPPAAPKDQSELVDDPVVAESQVSEEDESGIEDEEAELEDKAQDVVVSTLSWESPSESRPLAESASPPEENTAASPLPDVTPIPTPAEDLLSSPFGLEPAGQAVMARGWIEPAEMEIINWRAVVYGLLIFVLIGVGAFFYRMTAITSTKKKMEEFEFTIAEPAVEKFELNDPQRDIIQEQIQEMPQELELQETPDIQVTVQPTEVEVTQEVIQTDNIEIDTPEIDISSTEIDIDAPEEITEISETTSFALTPIAADASTPADIFKYEKPTPRNKPKLFTINRAPRPSRTLKTLPKAFGVQDVPAIGKLGPANVNLFGTGEFFRAMTRFGGVEARSAVDASLHWLAMHQEPDGHWDPSKNDGGAGVESGVSGLALLALMGGGHTTRRGEYRRNVLKGIEWLLQQQNKKNGAIDTNIYSHSITTIALCEAYGRARDERIGIAARKAVEYLEKGVNPDGGWRYSANSGDSDMSVSGWAMQALKTAKLAQIKFDHSVYSRGVSYVDSLTDMGAGQDSNGSVGYTFTPTQRYNGNPSMTAAGMVVRQFSGVGVKSHLLVKGADQTKSQAPSWQRKDFYHWYYATYSMHNMGGEYRIWWNRRIRDALLDNQSREGDHAGSWDPKGDRHGEKASRVYTTALGALCLEVYYRYSEALNSFGSAPDLDDLFLQ